MDSWSRGHSDSRICISCGAKADRKPPNACPEPRHHHRYESKRQRNNEYRRQRRADARAIGEVYRGGRGDMARKSSYNQQRHRDIRDLLFDRLGGHFCVICGFADKRALQFDHTNGGGSQHRRSVPSGTAYYRALVDIPPEEFRETARVMAGSLAIEGNAGSCR